MSRFRRAVVLMSGRRVGILEEIAGGSRFTYDTQWLMTPEAIPISATMPLRPEPYDANGVHPFFLNLLPEGWLLNISSKILKVSQDDPFGLLLITCGDCIGSVEIQPESTAEVK